jgi:signal transduction histidine kinase
VVLIARGLKSNILINLVVLSSVGTILLALVAVITHHRELLQSKIAQLNLVLVILDDTVRRSPRLVTTTESLSRFLTRTEVDDVAAIDRFGRPLLDERPHSSFKGDLEACVQAALSTGRQQLCFSGQTWGVFWLQDRYVMVGKPSLKRGTAVGAVGVVADLKDLYAAEKRSLKIFFVYALINVGILAAVGVYRITKIYLEPLQRLAKRAEDYSEDETGMVFAVRKEDNELHQLSKSLNLMLERIAADKQKLRATVNCLESANADLRRAQQEMIRTEKLASVGRLSAGIAHEIGNPIGIVMGYLELLTQENLDLDASEKGDFIRRAADEIGRINTIIRQLLDLSRPSVEGTTRTHVHDVISDISEVARLEPLMANIAFRLKLTAENDCVTADPNRLRQVFLNLILNAVDAIAAKSPSGDGSLEVRSHVDAFNDRGVDDVTNHRLPVLTIEVSDDGVGIPPESMGNIFDPFFTTKAPGKGTGLGLSVSFMIIEGLGGKITARGNISGGTTLVVTLPLCPAVPEVVAT